MPDVERGRPLDDPLGHEPPHAAGAREAVGAEAGRNPEAAHVGRPEDELPVGRECLGPLISRTTPISASDGTRTIAFCISSSKRGQSSSSSFPLKSAGIPSSDHGAQCRS